MDSEHVDSWRTVIFHYTRAVLVLLFSRLVWFQTIHRSVTPECSFVDRASMRKELWRCGHVRPTLTRKAFLLCRCGLSCYPHVPAFLPCVTLPSAFPRSPLASSSVFQGCGVVGRKKCNAHGNMCLLLTDKKFDGDITRK